MSAAVLDDRIRAAVALDPWAMPLSHTIMSRGTERVPVLAMFGHAFATGENGTSMRMLLDPETRATPPVDLPAAEVTVRARTSNGVDVAARAPVVPLRGGVHPRSRAIVLPHVTHVGFIDLGVVAEGFLQLSASRAPPDIAKHTVSAENGLRFVNRATAQFLNAQLAPQPSNAADAVVLEEATSKHDARTLHDYPCH
jgi:hypothetical protein